MLYAGGSVWINSDLTPITYSGWAYWNYVGCFKQIYLIWVCVLIIA